MAKEADIGGALAKGPLLPHGWLDGILSNAEREALFAWAISQEARFKPGRVYISSAEDRHQLDLNRRTVLKLRDLGPHEAALQQRLLAALPRIMATAGYQGPEPASIEFELNAYGEGGHFNPHLDIPVGPGRMTLGGQGGEDRVISSVYYFHREPKGFTGGALRLYRFGVGPDDAEESDSLAFEPRQNSLVVFPSWALHAVERVSCPSGRFEDYRFALNCWFCRTIGA